MPNPAIAIKRNELERFVTVAEFFCEYAGLPHADLPQEFERLRPEFQAFLERFKAITS